MKRILVLGAGRSSASLIKYLLEHTRNMDWSVTVGDASPENAEQKIGSSENAKAVRFDVREQDAASDIIRSADVVISLLPPAFHPAVALRCLEHGKHFLTASYVSPELKAFDNEVRSKGLLFLNECGLDPGIDHLSAMKVIDEIRAEGGVITSFESFTGGLIAPDTDPENPWRYKFTWNPHNVVTAGQNTAKYLYEGKRKYIPYQQLFLRTTPVYVPGYGHYEGYANRDSLQYVDMYGLNGIATMLRGTLRNKGFCSAWNVLVQLGCCDDSYEMENVSSMTHAGFIDSFLPPVPDCDDVEEKVCMHFGLKKDSPEIGMLKWSGFFDEIPINATARTPARILEHILNKKWALAKGDKDQIVMWHRFRYRCEGVGKEKQASLIATGTDDVYTAMSNTVGLPLGIATRLIVSNQINAKGVVIPTTPEFYDPILAELACMGIALNETQIR